MSAHQCDLCRRRPKNWNGSDPVCAFAEGPLWSPKNWNCATTGLIRSLFSQHNGKGRLPEGVFHDRLNDENLGIVSLVGREDLSLEGDPIALLAKWYKSRGRTDALVLVDDDGEVRRPTEEELVDIAETLGVSAEQYLRFFT